MKVRTISGKVVTGEAAEDVMFISHLKHPLSTTEYKNRTYKRRAKNRVAKASRKKNRGK